MTDAELRLLFAWTVLMFPFIDVTAAYLLWREVRRTAGAPRGLVERAWVATAIAAASLLIAVLGASVLAKLVLPPFAGLAILLIAIGLPSVASLGWLVRYFRGGFRDRVS